VADCEIVYIDAFALLAIVEEAKLGLRPFIRRDRQVVPLSRSTAATQRTDLADTDADAMAVDASAVRREGDALAAAVAAAEASAATTPSTATATTSTVSSVSKPKHTVENALVVPMTTTAHVEYPVLVCIVRRCRAT
jgi:hypothetical protein